MSDRRAHYASFRGLFTTYWLLSLRDASPSVSNIRYKIAGDMQMVQEMARNGKREERGGKWH